MASTFLSELALDGLSPAHVWHAFSNDIRREAAEALFARALEEPELRHQADAAVAAKLRFREQTVRKMPTEKKAAYFAKLIKPDDALASSLILAYHLHNKSALLAAFLDELGIANEDGAITDEEVETPTAAKLAAAVKAIDGRFEAEEVDVYLASLIAMDDDTWGGLLPILEKRKS